MTLMTTDSEPRSAFGRMRCLLVAACVAAASGASAQSPVQIDGTADAMTVTVADVPRGEVMSGIAERFGFTISGAIADAGNVSGRFRGDLGDVLMGILTANSFLIVYEGGRPATLLLSERSVGEGMPLDPALRTLQRGVPGEGMMGQNPDAQQYVDPTTQDLSIQGIGPPSEPEL